MPSVEPFRAWTNFEFIADDGSINEVDLLLVSTYRLYLVEIKSRPGRLTGDAGTWHWEHEGRTSTDDNPLLLANRKAKKLKSLLARQKPLSRRKLPFIEAIVFLSAVELRCELDEAARSGICLRPDLERAGRPDIRRRLSGDTDAGSGLPRIDHRLGHAIAQAVEASGIRPSQRQRRAGDYVLDRLLGETDLYQDWSAHHERLPDIRRRVRLFPHAPAAARSVSQERQQYADREFKALEGVTHPGILRAQDLIETERGPALVYEHDAQLVRLDHYLRDCGEQLGVGHRLALVRAIAETLQYAHGRRLYHRALGPQTILVGGEQLDQPRVLLHDWQLAQREADTRLGLGGLTASLRPTLYGEPQNLLYLAPEVLAGQELDGARIDVFALGALAYLVFSGQPPATGLTELQRKLDAGGLRLSEVCDGVTDSLQELVQIATEPRVEYRLASVGEFLQTLDEVENELTEPEPSADDVHPLDARGGETLAGGFVVERRLGLGGTSRALLVTRDGRRGVLKVALSPEHNERLQQEGRLLAGMRHASIVELYDQCDLRGHHALFLSLAGEQTLAQRLAQEGRLSLDLLQRFGEQLLELVDWLEQNGVVHRDIKPENIGIGETGSGRLRLVLFDFSLSSTPVDNLRAGTPPYLDPFLRLRRPPRWDIAAERYAAAVTLYQMATGELPRWGSDGSDPVVLDCEITLAVEAFDPVLREDLHGFFARALRRDSAARFDNGEEMLRAWRRVFARLDQPATQTTDDGLPTDLGEALAAAGWDSALSTLGLTPRVLDALDRIGAHTVGELLTLPRIRLYRNQGIGQRTVREIRNLRERLEAHGLTPAASQVADDLRGLDSLARGLIPAGIDDTTTQVLQTLLGLVPGGPGPGPWPAQREIAEHLGLARSEVERHITEAVSRWRTSKPLNGLRDEIAGLMDAGGGIMTLAELTEAVLMLRGSTLEGEARQRRAAAIVHAVLETENAGEAPRYVLYRGRVQVFAVATDRLAGRYAAPPNARAQYAERLGDCADALACNDPLLSPARVVEGLREVVAPAADPPLTAERLVQIAAQASRAAALSARLELYPRAMPAQRALRLSQGALVGVKALKLEALRARVQSRYPQAEPLPVRPALDALLREAGIELEWDGELNAYRPPLPAPTLATGTTAHRSATAGTVPGSPVIDAARRFEERLGQVLSGGNFVVLGVTPALMSTAAQALITRHGLDVFDLDALLIDALRKAASAAGARWDVVLQADARPRTHPDWQRLMVLVRRALPALERTLAGTGRPRLLLHAGLLLRYGAVALLERLREQCAQGPGVACLLLLPVDQQHPLPVLDGVAVPIINPSEWARVPDAWVRGEHLPSSPAAA